MATNPTPRAGFLLSLGIVTLVSLSARLYQESRETRVAFAQTPEGPVAIACVTAGR